MKGYYDNGSRNKLCVWVNFGRASRISYISEAEGKEVILQRTTADEKEFMHFLREFMEQTAKHRPEEFMDLFSNLYADAKAKEIAKEIYDAFIDKRKYQITKH